MMTLVGVCPYQPVVGKRKRDTVTVRLETGRLAPTRGVGLTGRIWCVSAPTVRGWRQTTAATSVRPARPSLLLLHLAQETRYPSRTCLAVRTAHCARERAEELDVAGREVSGRHWWTLGEHRELSETLLYHIRGV